MTQINKEKIKNITYESVNCPERFLSGKKMTVEVLEKALFDAIKKIDKLWEDVNGEFPSPASYDNRYKQIDNYTSEGWGTGFWTGMLWLAYDATGDIKYKERALSHIDSFYRKIRDKSGVNHHDMGFLYVPSCVAACKLTGDNMAKDAAIMAADHLLTRYIENGGYIQAWGDVGTHPRLIIDCMNNIPLLFWAAEATGDKTYYEKAYNHATVTINNIVREDASTHHTYFFEQDGTPAYGKTAQGAADNSCWARGQAWLISGLPLSYKYTKCPEMVDLFEKAANYYINRLPKDFVPFWDLTFTDGDDEPRDSSSAAIAVCGILEMLPNIADENLKEIYEGAVDKIMYSLYENYSTKDVPESNALLLHAVYSKPAKLGVDEANIWGCYYYMEALLRMAKGIKAYW